MTWQIFSRKKNSNKQDFVFIFVIYYEMKITLFASSGNQIIPSVQTDDHAQHCVFVNKQELAARHGCFIA